MNNLKKEYIDNLILNIISKIDEYPESNGLVSVILTGSLGRDEATLHLINDCEVVLDSDVELALVFKNGEKEKAEAVKAKLISDFTEDMNPMTINESRVKNAYNFNYSLLKPRYSSIFMYDLYNGSKTIWGKDLLNKGIATYDKYEAKRIVANRIGELVYLESTVSDDVKAKTVKQWEAKLLLAIGSAMSILNHKYASKYCLQKDYILTQEIEIKELLGENFVADYIKAYMFLREGASEFEVPRNQLKKYVQRVNDVFNVSNITKPQINSFSRKLKYAIACARVKAPFSLFACEKDIINDLLEKFVLDGPEVVTTANNWKKILY